MRGLKRSWKCGFVLDAIWHALVDTGTQQQYQYIDEDDEKCGVANILYMVRGIMVLARSSTSVSTTRLRDATMRARLSAPSIVTLTI